MEAGFQKWSLTTAAGHSRELDISHLEMPDGICDRSQEGALLAQTWACMI